MDKIIEPQVWCECFYKANSNIFGLEKSIKYMISSFHKSSLSTDLSIRGAKHLDNDFTAQLFSTNALSANTFSLNVFPSFTAIY